MSSITLWGAVYDTDYVDLPKTGGGTAKFSDASVTTAVAPDVAEGKIFLLADGTQATGTASGGGGGLATVTVMDSTITATDQDTNGYVAWVKTQWYDYMSETLVDDTNYIVTIDGTPYLCHANAVYGGSDIYCGDTEIVWGTPANSIYPFAIGSYASGNVQWMIGDNQPHSVKVERVISMSDSTTLITKTITQNGTYSAEDDDADGYSEVTVNVPTGSSGLTFEAGTYEPSADTSGEKILFANTHSEAPAFIMMLDATGTADTTSNTNMQFVWYDYYKLYGIGMPWSSSAYRYASAYYAYRATNTSALSVGGVHCPVNSDNAGSDGINYPRFWTDELGFTPNSASTSRYWRAGRTYKWIAIWRQT